jgi:phosphomannomutase
MEPCGLSQMIASRYGTVPVVRETGGLNDSIKAYTGVKGNGFTFHDYNAHDMFYVINEAIRRNKEGKYCPLAIETSGHAALKENYFLDDGAYLVTRLLVKMAKLKGTGKKLRDLIADLKLPAESKEIRMGFKDGVDFKTYGKTVLSELETYANKNGWTLAPSNYEGIRISFGKGQGDGWFLLRMSLHDPIMPLNIESDVIGGNKIIAKKLHEFLSTYDGLVIDNLTNFVNE